MNLLLPALCCLTTLAPPAPNRVADGDFERADLTFGKLGEPNRWSVSIHGQSDATVTFAPGVGRDGSRGVRYHKTAVGNQNIHVDQVVEVPPESICEVTAQVRGDGQLTPLLVVQAMDWSTLQMVIVPPSSDWQTVRLVFPTFGHRQVRLEWFPGATGELYTGVAGTSYLDDVTLQPLTDPPAALVRAFSISRPHPEAEVDLTRVQRAPVGAPRPLRRIVCRDGVLRYEDGGEVALWGLNIQTALSWEYQGRLAPLGLPLDAATLNRIFDENLDDFGPLGCTVIRAHLLPADFSDAAGHVRDTVYLDALDHLVARCAERGIYLYLTLMNEMSTMHCPDSFIKDHPRETWLFDPDFIARSEQYVRDLLTRPNRYTGRRLADEPALAVIELINEPAYLDAAGLQTRPEWAPYRQAFETWAGRHGAGVPSAGLFASWRYEMVAAWLRRMCGAVRATGASQPIVWNLNWPQKIRGHEDVFQAVADSPVDAVSFCCYPGQSDVPHPYWANPAELTGRNYLPYLRTQYTDYQRLRWLLGTRFAGKAKCVYEYETMYNQSGYGYPALARLFRALGAQIAQMWEYTLAPAAERHGGSHFLNLACTPTKALSFRVASEVFATTDRLAPFALTTDTTLVEPTWAASFDHDLSLVATPDSLLASGPLTWQPLPLPTSPRHLAGRGDSPLVSYDGTGAWFVDVTGDRADVLLLPDHRFLQPPWQRATRDRRLTVELRRDVDHTFALRLPGWTAPGRVERLEGEQATPVTVTGPGCAFTARPGRYRIRR